MIPFGVKIPKEPSRKGYDCEKATYKKYGKEISAHDFIQGGREGTIAKEIVQKAGGIMQLEGANKKLPTSDIVLDLNMDPYTAQRILKTGKIAQEQLNKVIAEKQTKQEKPKETAKNE